MALNLKKLTAFDVVSARDPAIVEETYAEYLQSFDMDALKIKEGDAPTVFHCEGVSDVVWSHFQENDYDAAKLLLRASIKRVTNHFVESQPVSLSDDDFTTHTTFGRILKPAALNKLGLSREIARELATIIQLANNVNDPLDRN